MYYGVIAKPKVLFTFDDGWASTHDIVFPILATAGFKATSYIVSGSVGNAGIMTKANISELYNAGWTIGNHTATHPDFTTMTEAQIEANIRTCQEWLISNGYSKTAKHFAIPNGTYNADVITAMTNVGLITARSSNVTMFYADVYPSLYLPAEIFHNTVTLATAQGWVDTAISKGQTLILMLHQISASAPTTDEWKTTDFQALVSYIKDRKVDVVTMDEWYRGLTDPRYTSTPPGRVAA